MKLYVVEIEKGHPSLRKDTLGDFTKDEMEMIAHRFNSHDKLIKIKQISYEAICTGDQEASDKVIGLIEDFEQFLKEAEKK